MTADTLALIIDGLWEIEKFAWMSASFALDVELIHLIHGSTFIAQYGHVFLNDPTFRKRVIDMQLCRNFENINPREVYLPGWWSRRIVLINVGPISRLFRHCVVYGCVVKFVSLLGQGMKT